ncbi:MAG: hypothetical protein DRP64_10515, partial [Verrucomicrobia bacterium]
MKKFTLIVMMFLIAGLTTATAKKEGKTGSLGKAISDGEAELKKIQHHEAEELKKAEKKGKKKYEEAKAAE